MWEGWWKEEGQGRGSRKGTNLGGSPTHSAAEEVGNPEDLCGDGARGSEGNMGSPCHMEGAQEAVT